jgi:excisionase family DNA binding protein
VQLLAVATNSKHGDRMDEPEDNHNDEFLPPRPRNKGHRLKEAAKRIGVSPSTIYRHAAAGKINLVKIGGATILPDAELVRLLRHGTRPMRHKAK